MPDRIFARLASEWKLSPSANGQRSMLATSAPTVLLPLPDTPATIRITARSLACPRGEQATSRNRTGLPGVTSGEGPHLSGETEEPAGITLGASSGPPAGLLHTAIRSTCVAGSTGYRNFLPHQSA